jgi:hypothetical protein
MKQIESTINVTSEKEKEFAHFQFKVPTNLWNRFKIKTIKDNSPTYRQKLIELIEEYVRT